MSLDYTTGAYYLLSISYWDVKWSGYTRLIMWLCIGFSPVLGSSSHDHLRCTDTGILASADISISNFANI